MLNLSDEMKIVECPRDAMQGITEFIPTDKKIRYLNTLLKIGFDTLDFGSFVSAKAIPQMRDTEVVLNSLDISSTTTSLLAIVANVRGAEKAASFEAITYLGFPLSISETFQKRNTNKSIAEALNELSEIQDICTAKNKKLVTYISMGFGNPYGDPWQPELVNQFVEILVTLGSSVISLADTVGAASEESITSIVSSLMNSPSKVEFGVHLHSNPSQAVNKIHAAYSGGCRRFDGALKGFGGCPMANDSLVGNIATEEIVSYLESQGMELRLNKEVLNEALAMIHEIFPIH
jgi:hydroxymethylglutaryl-CoA lyase